MAEFDFTHKNLDVNNLIERVLKNEEARTLLELRFNRRAKFEKERCPKIGKDISLRTKPDGEILGVVCEHYKMNHEQKFSNTSKPSQYPLCGKYGGDCVFGYLIGK